MSDFEPQSPPKLSTKIEAILYLKAQPMGIQEIADLALRDREEVEEALLELMQDYALRESALEVVETDVGFSLQLREPYSQLVHTVVPTDIGIGALRTLAVIALKGPIPQTELVELRGSGAYQHVQALVDEGFVGKRRSGNGRSYSVNVTQKFYQYFEVDELPKIKLKRNLGEATPSPVAIAADPAEQSVADSGMNDSGMNDSGMDDPGMSDSGMNDSEAVPVTVSPPEFAATDSAIAEASQSPFNLEVFNSDVAQPLSAFSDPSPNGEGDQTLPTAAEEHIPDPDHSPEQSEPESETESPLDSFPVPSEAELTLN